MVRQIIRVCRFQKPKGKTKIKAITRKRFTGALKQVAGEIMITEKAFTRLTLALDIMGKEVSGPYKGYHRLGIVKHQIALADTISVEESGSLSIECDDRDVPCDERNICWRAVEMFRRRFGIDKNARISIEKAIPVKGGLAGGSADAATVLRSLDRLWGTGLSKDQLIGCGRELGMDIPFFFEGGTAFDTETTGVLKSIRTGVKFTFLLAVPEFGVSTGGAYAGVDCSVTAKRVSDTEKMIGALKRGDRDLVVKMMHNDFERTVFARFPRLRELRDRMICSGCESAVMSGSGSTLVGVVRNTTDAEKISRLLDCKCIITETLL